LESKYLKFETHVSADKGNRCALFRFRNNEQDEKVVEVIKAKKRKVVNQKEYFSEGRESV